MRPEHRASVESTVTAAPLPGWVREATELDRIDYCDCFLVQSTAARGAEEWARDVLEGAPARLRRRLPRAWSLLGLRHGSTRSPRHVLGWPIRLNTSDLVVLSARSRIGMPAELVFARDGNGWLFATLIQHDNRVVAAMWRTIADSHRRVVRYLLRSAAGRRSDRTR